MSTKDMDIRNSSIASATTIIARRRRPKERINQRLIEDALTTLCFTIPTYVLTLMLLSPKQEGIYKSSI
jgi:hypothetical protein